MPLNRTIGVVALLTCACGPRAGDSGPTDASWLIGVYSLQAPTTTDAQDFHVERYTFDDMGGGLWQQVSFERVADEFPLTWELDSTQEAFVYPNAYDEAYDFWYTVRPGADCNTLEFTYVYPSGSTLGPVPLHRGEVCSRQPDPDTPTYYERYWCDEPPPSCEDP